MSMYLKCVSEIGMHISEVIQVSLRHELDQRQALGQIVIPSTIFSCEYESKGYGCKDQQENGGCHDNVSSFY